MELDLKSLAPDAFVARLEEAANKDPLPDSLVLEFCMEFTDEHMYLLSPFASSLTKLNLNGCNLLTDSGLQMLASFQKDLNLSWLSLYWVPKITDKGLLPLVPKLGQRLEYLSLSGMKHITDESVKAIATLCPNITHLDLTRAEKLRDPALLALAGSCHKLSYLNLYACTSFHDKGIIAICQSCPDLSFLDICGSRFISNASLREMSRLSKLESLNLTWCQFHIDNEGISYFGEGGTPHLKRLFIHGLFNLTDEAIEALSKGCPELEVLDINGIASIKDKSEETMKRLFPKFKELVQL